MADSHDQNRPAGSAVNRDDRNAGSSLAGGGFFEIHVRGHLNREWSDWLDGLEIKLLENGEMVLSGVVVDQAALMGILNKINRLNLTLLSVSEASQKRRQNE